MAPDGRTLARSSENRDIEHTVDLVDDVVRDEEESGASVEDGGVARALLLGATEGPRGRWDLPEALRTVEK